MRGQLDGTIGIDEAGKGDYFGPLVIAACFSNEKIEKEFIKFGLKESKRVSDFRISILEKEIKNMEKKMATLMFSQQRYKSHW